MRRKNQGIVPKDGTEKVTDIIERMPNTLPNVSFCLFYCHVDLVLRHVVK
ncbi:hypothetical protein BC792_11730 [Sphingobacterium allocomposti]|uniref:Uncharacterized protein n=1 Tax=Sphingobacterium allocomposti TaxID=415956 RepID=A0A5S5D9B4_9SPHI|nr:hypothetical protein [Sphingobacterium composti Yoo et al. 2007 non Ten et al. 2007]TYP92255.1 hypothetical protein BC792_11730 [Sphingobacterium composti Yoo et al. 2007 non Ten et al. 2007]